MDITSPFPYPRHKIPKPNIFCWNKRFLKLFAINNALSACVILLCGGFYNYQLDELSSITIVIKRIAKLTSDNFQEDKNEITKESEKDKLENGKNESIHELINEIEYELIYQSDAGYFSHIWRRGGPPILLYPEMHNDLLCKIMQKYIFHEILSRFSNTNSSFVALVPEMAIELNKIDTQYFYLSDNHYYKFFYVLFNEDDPNIIKNLLPRFPSDNNSYFTKVVKGNEIESIQSLVFRLNDSKLLEHSYLVSFVISLILLLKLSKLDPKLKNPNHQENKPENISDTKNDNNSKDKMENNNEINNNQKCDIDELNTEFIQENPCFLLKENIVDFLCKVFIESESFITGKIIDKRNIRKDLIGKYLSKSFKSNFTVIKPLSIEQITEFLFPIHKNHCYTLDSQHISCTSKQNFKQLLLKESEFIHKFQTKCKINCMFSEPFIVYGIALLLIPQNYQNRPRFNISFGNGQAEFFSSVPKELPIVDKKEWVTYNLHEITKTSVQFPPNPSNICFSSFVKILFDCPNSAFIGNIKFLVKQPSKHFFKYVIKKQISNDYDYESISPIIEANDHHYLMKLIEFEKNRIKSGFIDSQFCIRNIENMKSPFLYDFKAQCIQKYDNKCPFCLNDLKSDFPFVKLNPVLEYCVIPSNKKQKNAFQICEECYNVILESKFEQFFNENKEKLIIVGSQIKKNKNIVYNYKNIQLNKTSEFLLSNFAKFQFDFKIANELNKCLIKKSDVKLEGKLIGATLCFAFPAVVNKITITLKEKDSEAFLEIYTKFKNSNIVFTKSSSTTYEFLHQEHESNTSNEIISKCPIFFASTNKNPISFTVQRIEVLGSFYPLTEISGGIPESPKFPKMRIIKIESTWNKLLRTQTFEINSQNTNIRIKGIRFQVTDIHQMPHSLIIGFYLANEFRYHQSVILPSFNNKSNVIIPFNTDLIVPFDKIVIYYLDRICSIKPFDIQFVS